MYYDLFVHSSSETIEEEKMSTTTKQNKTGSQTTIG
jgi:hypothetical protein